MESLALKNLIKNFVKNFALLVTEYGLYPPQHPNIIAQTRQTFSCLEQVLRELDEVYVDVVEGLFAYEGIPFYELKHGSEKSIQLLESKHLRSFCFKKGIVPQHLTQLLVLIVDKLQVLNAADMQKALDKAGIASIVVEKTHSPEDSKNTKDLLPPEKIYGSSVEANKLVYSAAQKGNIIPMDVVDKVAQDITAMIARDSSSSLALASLRDYDEYTFTHSANVAILSVAVASSIIQDTDLLNRLARAAILHDIGKTMIPLTILNKPEKLDDAEWKLMRSHPMFGAQILEQQPEVDKLAVLIATQHHMKYDLSGYPLLEGIERLYPLSLIVNICDIYDAITSKRPYKKPLPPDKALAIMMRLIGCDFDPAYFKIFIQMIGVYPPGCFVRLNTMELAITKKIRPKALLLPEIKIVMDATGMLLESPVTIDLASKAQNASGRAIEEVVDPAELGINPLGFI